MAEIESSEALRRRILSEHARVRAAMGRVLVAPDDARLLVAANALIDAVADTLDDEEAELEPALRDVDAWGAERVRRLRDEHAQVRAQVAHVRRELATAPAGSPFGAAAAVRDFVDWLSAELAAEEREALGADLLRDDAISVEIGA